MIAAFANGTAVEVYHGEIVHDMKHAERILRVDYAQVDDIQQLQLFYDIAKEEVFLITSAK